MLENREYYRDQSFYEWRPAPRRSVEENERARQPRRGKRRRSNRSSARMWVASVAACAVFGFVGGMVSGRAVKSQSVPPAGAQTEVLYQAVIRTAASGDNADEPMTMAATASVVKQTVVEITTETVSTNGRMGQLISEGAGSGVIITADGYIVTNNHVISGARSITVRLPDGAEYAAALVGSDAKTDLAILKIGAAGLTPAVLGDSSTLTVGETLVAVGNPLGELGGSVSSGILSALDREIAIDGETMRLLQTDAAINPGNSGGGLYNLYGELVGVVNAKSSGTDVEGLGFAIPVNTAKTVIADLMAHGYVQGRIDTGLTLLDISSAQSAMVYRVNQTGLYIRESTHGELRSGDRITAVDGNEITGLSSYNALMDAHAVGDTVRVTVSRNGQSLAASITLGEMRS